jgi:hypothetical protein
MSFLKAFLPIANMHDENIILMFYNDRQELERKSAGCNSRPQKMELEYLMDIAQNPQHKLVKILKDLLHTDEDLDFLLQLRQENLEKLVATVRARLER